MQKTKTQSRFRIPIKQEMPSFGEWLKEQRKKKGWSGNEFARRLGISSAYMCDLEQGNRVPSETVMEKIIEVTNCMAADCLRHALQSESPKIKWYFKQLAHIGGDWWKL